MVAQEGLDAPQRIFDLLSRFYANELSKDAACVFLEARCNSLSPDQLESVSSVLEELSDRNTLCAELWAKLLLEAFTRVGRVDGRIHAHNTLGHIFYQRKEFEAALGEFKRALDLLQEHIPPPKNYELVLQRLQGNVGPREPPRVYRRLQRMRRGSHEARSKEVFAGGAGARRANGVGTRRGVPIAVGSSQFGRG